MCSSAPRGLHEDVRDVLDALQHIRRATRTLVHPQRIGQVLDVNVCRLHLDLDRLFRAIAGETRSLQGGQLCNCIRLLTPSSKTSAKALTRP